MHPEPTDSVLHLFAAPRSFVGQVAVTQTNALKSWRLGIRPAPKITLFGSEPGIAEAAEALGAVHVSQLAHSPSGAPLLDYLIQRADAANGERIPCYINSDIVVIGDLDAAVRTVAMRFRRFLVVARRVDVDLGGLIDFSSDWVKAVSRRAAEVGDRDLGNAGSDLFAFSPGLLDRVPPLSVGRCAWDNWIIAEALRQKAAVIDATGCLTLLHQPHDYEHAGIVGTGMKALRELARSPEARENLALAGGPMALRTVDDATHRLVPSENGIDVVRAPRGDRLMSAVRRLDTTARFHVRERLNELGRSGSRR